MDGESVLGGLTPIVRLALGLLAVCLSVPEAEGQDGGPAEGQGHTFVVGAQSTIIWDSNVFRVPDGVADPDRALGILGRSDRFTMTTFGLRVDKAYSEQEFLLDVSETAVRYDKFSLLDRNTPAYHAAWRWSISPRLTGVIGTDYSQNPIPFEDTAGNLQHNISTTSGKVLTVDGWIVGGLHLIGGVSGLKRSDTFVFQGLPSIDQTTLELGVKYVAPSQSSVTASRRVTHGTNVGQPVDNSVLFIDSEYTMKEFELRGTWIATGKSTVNARVTLIERHNPDVPQRDFSGTSSELTYVWRPTGKVTVNGTANRTVVPFALDTATTFRVDNTLLAEPVWQVSDKLRLSVRMARLASSYLQPVIPIAAPSRRDVTDTLLISASWMPLRQVTVSAVLRRDSRSSNTSAFQFNDTLASINASVAF